MLVTNAVLPDGIANAFNFKGEKEPLTYDMIVPSSAGATAAAISSACWGRSCVGFGGAIGVTTVLSMMGPLQWGQAKTFFMPGV